MYVHIMYISRTFLESRTPNHIKTVKWEKLIVDKIYKGFGHRKLKFCAKALRSRPNVFKRSDQVALEQFRSLIRGHSTDFAGFWSVFVISGSLSLRVLGRLSCCLSFLISKSPCLSLYSWSLSRSSCSIWRTLCICSRSLSRVSWSCRFSMTEAMRKI